ncbi:MAG: HD domain-containing protein [Synergistaceae bacterium]|nr:HD domain-containing protein [Synergistaceae bacterium]
MKNNVFKYNVVAAIDIGSYSIKMKIAGVGQGGSVTVLETPKRLLNIGKDIFSTGKIKNELIEEICSILKNYKKLIAEYKADKVMIVATSSFREADNCDYLLDHVYRKTGFKIEVISESVEKFYMYSSIKDALPNFHKLKKEGVLIADVGSGGLETGLFFKGELVFTQYIRMGALRLKEVLSDLERRTLNFPNLISEYIESEIDTLKPLLLKNPINNFIIVGSEIRLIHNILKSNSTNYDYSSMTKKDFYTIYRQIVGKSQKQIIDTYQINQGSVEILVPALLIYEKFLSFTYASVIYTPDVSLCDGILRYLTDKKFNIVSDEFSYRDIVISVKKMCERYSYDIKHSEYVEKISLSFFDNSRCLHGYSVRERLYLQIAAIAHDVGKYINLKEHNVISHNIVLHSDILGLSKNEIRIIANVIKYHSHTVPSIEDTDYVSLDFKSRLTVSKLAAYLKIADSLDKSHKQKLFGVRVVSDAQTFSIRAETDQDCLLEEWEFDNKSNLFKEIYGIRPTLLIERR